MTDKYKYKAVNLLNGSCFVSPTSKFYLRYEKGTKVKAKKSTLGIMVFTTREHATRFVEANHCIHGCIKKVIPIGKLTIPKYISGLTMEKGIELFNKIKPEDMVPGFHCMSPPVGTECYPAVLVVD